MSDYNDELNHADDVVTEQHETEGREAQLRKLEMMNEDGLSVFAIVRETDRSDEGRSVYIELPDGRGFAPLSRHLLDGAAGTVWKLANEPMGYGVDTEQAVKLFKDEFLGKLTEEGMKYA